MTKIIFIQPDGSEKTVDAQNGLSLLEVAHSNGIDLEGACEGSLACSTCHIIVDKVFFEIFGRISKIWARSGLPQK